MTVTQIVMTALGTIPKSLVKVLEELEIGGRDPPKILVLLRSTRILRRALES